MLLDGSLQHVAGLGLIGFYSEELILSEVQLSPKSKLSTQGQELLHRKKFIVKNRSICGKHISGPHRIIGSFLI